MIAINNVYVPDFQNMCFVKANVVIEKGVISAISQKAVEAKHVIDAREGYLTPGLIDCHCHIESSHLLPSSFGNEIVKHGSLFAVCDCHEVANVKGRAGVEMFMNDAKRSACNLKFAVPSCVPATEFATSGGRIDVEDVEYFMDFDDVVALGELMNVPGIVNRDDKFMKMIDVTKRHNKRVNGHAPHLSSDMLKKYIAAGVEDDHESETYEELKEKIEAGMRVFIREGSAEKTKESAYKIINEYPDRVMFCTDDKTIGDIRAHGHINYNLRKAVSLGIEPILALRAATYNGLKYYGLDEYSEIKIGARAYLVLFDREFNVKNIIVNGEVFKDTAVEHNIPNNFLNTINLNSVNSIPKIQHKNLSMSVSNGSLITDKVIVESNLPEFDLRNDILKMCVFERYGHNNRSACRIKGFGLKKGAIASSLSHDCHNIIVVGTSDESIKIVVNKIIDEQGGMALFDGDEVHFMPLVVCGVVSLEDANSVAEDVEKLKKLARELGSKLDDAFAMLSFMALEVIPHLKLTDRGLFDVDNFRYIDETTAQ